MLHGSNHSCNGICIFALLWWVNCKYERPKNGLEKRGIYITSMLECWKHDSGRMPRGTWQECVLWLNIPVSHPAIRGVLATQGDVLNIAHLTRRMYLFESSIPLWVLLWESFYIHTHTILSPACPSLPDSLPSGTQQLFSLHIPITTIPECWLVTPYLWLNKRREVFSPPTVFKTT